MVAIVTTAACGTLVPALRASRVDPLTAGAATLVPALRFTRVDAAQVLRED